MSDVITFPTKSARQPWPSGGGQMGELVRTLDWSQTPLGLTSGWSQALRTAVEIVLQSPLAMALRWGPDLIQVYNDAYIPIAGAKHPRALGQPTKACWPEAWPFLEQIIPAVFRGEARAFSDRKLTLERTGTPEDVWFDLTYSPVRDEMGEIAGMLVTAVDTTARVMARAEQQRAEERSRMMGERLAAVLESTTDCVFVLDRNWRFSFLNARAVHEIAGGRDLLGADLWEAFPEAVGSPFEAHYRRVMDERVPVRFEAYYPPLAAWFEVNAYPAEDGLAVFFHNVTERKRADAALRESQSRLEIATAAANLGVWDWDLSTDEIVYSERAKAIHGLPPDQPVTLADLRTATHAEDLPRTTAMAARAVDPAMREKEPYEYRIVRPSDGETRWVLAHGEAVFDTVDGVERAVRYTGTLQDITDRKLAEDAVQESEARLRLAIEAGRMAVWVYDVGSNAVRGSPELNRLLGFPDDATPTTEDLRSRYYPGEHERLRAAAEKALAGGERFFHVEYRVRWPDRSIRWLLLRAEIVLAPEGKPVSVIGVVLDITDRKRAEEHQSLLINELNHRVKNTLATVQSIAAQSFRGGASDEVAREAFEARLLALSKAHDVLTRENWEGADLGAVVAEVIEPYRAGRGRFEVTGPNTRLSARAALSLSMALHELATNAAKYGALTRSEGGVSISWSLVEGEPRRLVLEWREHGGPPVAPPSRKGFGTRLIERGLARELDGAVHLTFEPGGVVCRVNAPLSAD